MTNSELAGRLTRAARWQWMPGMCVVRSRVSGRVQDADESFIIAHFDGPTRDGGGLYDGPIAADMLPDLTDPATLGCLLALVREAWGEPNLGAYYSSAVPGWMVAGQPVAGGWVRTHEYLKAFPTEAAALVAALEAAP